MDTIPLQNNNLLTIEEFCQLLKISERSCYRLLKHGLPSIKAIGVGRRILRDQALNWLQAGGAKRVAKYRRTIKNV